MTEEDIVIVNLIVQLFKTKELTPKRFFTKLSIKNNIYTAHINRLACCIAAVLIDTETTVTSIDGDTYPILYQDTADILKLPVATVMGIATGFDHGKTQSVGPEDTRGIQIGAAIADQVFKTPNKNIRL